MHGCMYVRTYARMYACKYICIYTYIYINYIVRIYNIDSMCMYVCMNEWMNEWMNECVMCIYKIKIRIRIYKYNVYIYHNMMSYLYDWCYFNTCDRSSYPSLPEENMLSHLSLIEESCTTWKHMILTKCEISFIHQVGWSDPRDNNPNPDFHRFSSWQEAGMLDFSLSKGLPAIQHSPCWPSSGWLVIVANALGE